jgi:uncharacterized protein with HEPN domain
MSFTPRETGLLLDMLESAERVLEYVEGVSQEAFLANLQLQDAVVRRLTVIGEAARSLSNATRASIPEIPWTSIIGARNVVVHQYSDLDMVRIWETATQSLPPLAVSLRPYIPPQE